MTTTLMIDGAPPDEVVERAVFWSFAVDRWLIDNPDVLEALPDEATLVILPDDDPELAAHNLRLSRHIEGAQVLVRLERLEDAVRVMPFLPTPASLNHPRAH